MLSPTACFPHVLSYFMTKYAQLKIEELHQMLQETSTLEGELESLCTHSPNIFISVRKPWPVHLWLYLLPATLQCQAHLRLFQISETAQPTTSASQPIAAIHQKADTGAKMFAQSVPSMSRDLDALSEGQHILQ